VLAVGEALEAPILPLEKAPVANFRGEAGSTGGFPRFLGHPLVSGNRLKCVFL